MSQQNSLFSSDVGPLLVNTDQFVSASVSDNPTDIGQWEDNSRLTGEVTDTTPLVQNVLPLVGFSVAQTMTTGTEGFHILHSNTEPVTMVNQRYLEAEPTECLQTGTELMVEPSTGLIQPSSEFIVLQHGIPGPSGDMCSTTYLNDGFTKQVKIFREVTAVLSTEILSVIQGSQSVLFQTIQSDYGVQLSLASEAEREVPEIHISGDLSALTKVERKLASVCGVSYADNDSAEIDNVMTVNTNINKETDKSSANSTGSDVACAQIKKPETVDKSISCDLLQPTISQRGRVIKPLSRYNSYVQLNSFLETEDIDDNPRGRRKRKTRPQRLNSTQGKHVDQSENNTEPVQSLTSQIEEPTQLAVSSSIDEGDQTKDKLVTADISQQNVGTAETERCSDENTEESELASDTPREKKAKTKKDYERLAPFKFFCKKCSFRTKRLSHYNNHKRLHEKQLELHRCKKCSFSSLRLSHLNRHEATHSIKIFSCDKCTYNTHQFKLLDRHKRAKHHPDKDYIKVIRRTTVLSCPCCDYSTERPFHYQRHMRTHPEFAGDADPKITEDGKSFCCDLCPYTTQRKECLYRHKGNKHSDKRPYLCDLCGKSFKRPDALVQHKVTHIDKTLRNYQFKCEICKKVFRSQAHLTDHQDSHSTQKSHLCYICGTAFKTRSVQRKHMQTIHLNPGAFHCQHCQKRFNTKFALNRHVHTHLSEQSSNTLSQIINTADVSGTEITTETQHIQVHQVQDVIVPSVGEVYEPTGEAIQQALIQTDKGPATVYYLPCMM